MRLLSLFAGLVPNTCAFAVGLVFARLFVAVRLLEGCLQGPLPFLLLLLLLFPALFRLEMLWRRLVLVRDFLAASPVARVCCRLFRVLFFQACRKGFEVVLVVFARIPRICFPMLFAGCCLARRALVRALRVFLFESKARGTAFLLFGFEVLKVCPSL